MALLAELRARYSEQLGPLETSFASDPVEVWRFKLDATRPTEVEIEDMGGGGYWIGIDESPMGAEMNQAAPTDSRGDCLRRGSEDEFLYFELFDRSGESLADFVEACAERQLIEVRWSAGNLRGGWWLENSAGANVSCERAYRKETLWFRFISSRSCYRQERTLLSGGTA